MRVEDFQQPRTGVLGHGDRVAEGEARGGDPFLVQAAQPIVHAVEGRTGHRRDIEIAREGLDALARRRLQRIRGGGIALVGARPETGGGLDAEGVIDLVRGRLIAVGIGPRDGHPDVMTAIDLQPAPDTGQGSRRELHAAEARGRPRAERRDRAEHRVAGAPVQRLGGDHAVDGPHGIVALGAFGEGQFQVAHGAIGRRIQQGAHRGELALGQLAHDARATPDETRPCC